MVIVHTKKTKKKRFEKLKALYNTSYSKLPDMSDNNKPHDYEEEDEFEAEDEEFEDLEDVDTAFDLSIEFLG